MKKFLSTNVAAIVLIAAFALVSFTNTTKEVNEKVNTEMAETTITKYEVVSASSTSSMKTTMFYKMESGWQPLGGISFGNGNFVQVIVK